LAQLYAALSQIRKKIVPIDFAREHSSISKSSCIFGELAKKRQKTPIQQKTLSTSFSIQRVPLGIFA
jgi:hypothetical protein